jgi:hypothetical protein
LIIDLPAGKRSLQTLRKLPTDRPRTVNIAKNRPCGNNALTFI